MTTTTIILVALFIGFYILTLSWLKPNPEEPEPEEPNPELEPMGLYDANAAREFRETISRGEYNKRTRELIEELNSAMERGNLPHTIEPVLFKRSRSYKSRGVSLPITHDLLNIATQRGFAVWGQNRQRSGDADTIVIVGFENQAAPRIPAAIGNPVRLDPSNPDPRFVWVL